MEHTFGDCSVLKKYSHIDLLHMIDGVEMQKATTVAGNRCYYLKVGVSGGWSQYLLILGL